jgi:hypothetical protein
MIELPWGMGSTRKNTSFPIGKAEDAAKAYQTFAEINCVKHTVPSGKLT